MTDRPIIFSAPMVRALLKGRKTQTRRVLKQHPYDLRLRPGMEGYKPTPLDLWQIDNDGPFFRVPYNPGDRLYVREAFAMNPAVRHPERAKNVTYRADVPDKEPPAGLALTMDRLMWAGAELCKWKPSIHMPRWASRLTLTVTDVRVQRLQDISDADAVAEGMPPLMNPEPVEAYRNLWNSLHGPNAWDENQWVSALTFTVQHGNIDMKGGA